MAGVFVEVKLLILLGPPDVESLIEMRSDVTFFGAIWPLMCEAESRGTNRGFIANNIGSWLRESR